MVNTYGRVYIIIISMGFIFRPFILFIIFNCIISTLFLASTAGTLAPLNPDATVGTVYLSARLVVLSHYCKHYKSSILTKLIANNTKSRLMPTPKRSVL